MTPNDPNASSSEPEKQRIELQTTPAPYRQTNPNIPATPAAPAAPGLSPQPRLQPWSIPAAPQQPSAMPQSPALPQPGFVPPVGPQAPQAAGIPPVGPQRGYPPPSAPLPQYAPPMPQYAPPSAPQRSFTAPPQTFPAPGMSGMVPAMPPAAPPQPFPQQQMIPQARGVIRDYDLGDRTDGWADTVEDAGDKADDVLRIFLKDAPGRLNFPVVRMLASDLGVTGLNALAKGIDNPFWPGNYGAIIRRGANALLRSWFGFVLVLGIPVLLLIFAASLGSSAPIASALIVLTVLLLIAYLPLLLMAVPFVFTRSVVGERRLYQFAVMLPGASVAVAVKRTGRDLYMSWDLFVRRLWNEAVLGIILLMSAIPSLLLALAFSGISSQPVTVPSANPFASPTTTQSSPLGGFLVLLSVFVAGTIILAIIYSIVLIIAGLIFKRDPLAFFLKEPTLFEYHDISAMTISVDKALRQAADQAGISVALRPKEQYQVGPRQRLI